MRLYYDKATAVALATFLISGTASVHACNNFSDVSFKFTKEEDNNFNPDFTGLNTILRTPDSVPIKNHTERQYRLSRDEKSLNFRFVDFIRVSNECGHKVNKSIQG